MGRSASTARSPGIGDANAAGPPIEATPTAVVAPVVQSVATPRPVIAIGQPEDLLRRLQLWLPSRWFPNDQFSPDGSVSRIWSLLSGYASALSWIYAQIAYVRQQTRIGTAVEGWLDLISWDYFRGRLPRFYQEPDDRFRTRIKGNLFAELGTRAGLIRVIKALTGTAPRVFEPGNPRDSGVYNDARTLAYNTRGGWGSLGLPYQAFVTVKPPVGGGVANVAAYLSVDTPGQRVLGGYGTGAIMYVGKDMVRYTVSNADIYDAIIRAIPAATIAWTVISAIPFSRDQTPSTLPGGTPGGPVIYLLGIDGNKIIGPNGAYIIVRGAGGIAYVTDEAGNRVLGPNDELIVVQL